MAPAAMIAVFMYFGLLWLNYRQKQRFRRRKRRLLARRRRMAALCDDQEKELTVLNLQYNAMQVSVDKAEK